MAKIDIANMKYMNWLAGLSMENFSRSKGSEERLIQSSYRFFS